MRAFTDAWRVAWRIIGLTFRARLEYRSEFLLNVGVGVLWQVSIIVFATVLLGRFPGMGGWPSDAVLMIAATRMLGHSLYVLFFGRTYLMSYLIQEGFIDAFLMRPMPVHRQVQLAYFPSNAFGDLLVGVPMFVGAVLRLDLHWTPARIAYLTAGVLGCMLVEAAVFTTMSALEMHFPAASGWSQWTQELFATFGNYPLKILPGLLNGAFTFILPLAFAAYLPTAVLTGRTSGLGVPWAVAAASPLIALAAYIGSRLLWNASLRRYSGVNG